MRNQAPSNGPDRALSAPRAMASGAEPKTPPEFEANTPCIEATNKFPEDALELAISDVRNDTARLEDDAPDKSGDDDEAEDAHVVKGSSFSGKAAKKNAGFSCMDKHDGTSKTSNPNVSTMDKLQEMATSYDRVGDQWRTKAFREAIGKLRRQDQQIRTIQQAQDIGIGESVARQIEEMVATGQYKRLEYAQNDPRTQVLKLFMGVYGAGAATAEKWSKSLPKPLPALLEFPFPHFSGYTCSVLTMC